MNTLVKNGAVALALAASASAAWSEGNASKDADVSKSTLVRSDVSVDRPRGKGHGRPGSAHATSPLVVDSTGTVVGRYVYTTIPGAMVLLNYADDLLLLPINPEQNTNVPSGYFTWGTWGASFTTPDCTGNPYLQAYYGIGAKYTGVNLKDKTSGTFWTYVFNHQKAGPMHMQSQLYIDGASCYTRPEGYDGVYMPLEDAFPSNDIGTPPLKFQ